MNYDDFVNLIYSPNVITHSAVDDIPDISTLPKYLKEKESKAGKRKYSNKDISAIFENNKYVFIKVNRDDETDNTIIMVDKNTLEAKEILYTEYILKYSSSCKVAEGKDELKHSGVPQTPDGKGSGRYRKIWFEKGTKSRQRVEKLEKAHAIGAVAASNSAVVATTAAYLKYMAQQALLSNPVVQKIINNPGVQTLIQSGLPNVLLEWALNPKPIADVYAERRDNRKGKPDKNGIYRLEKKETIDETIDNANPYHGTALGNRNCWSCAIASSLRENNMDVVAKPIAMGVPSLMYWACLKNPKQVTRVLPGMNNFIDAKHMKQRISEAYGNPKNANGVIMVRWNGGGGHAFNWTMKNGNMQFYDSQIKEHDLNLVTRYFHNVNNYSPIMVYRMDNAKLDANRLKNWFIQT